MAGDSSITAFPDGDNLFRWVATIAGGPGTAYESLSYKLSLSFPSQYPYAPPIVKFMTPCYHPNVDNHGNICLDILKVLELVNLNFYTCVTLDNMILLCFFVGDVVSVV